MKRIASLNVRTLACLTFGLLTAPAFAANPALDAVQAALDARDAGISALSTDRIRYSTQDGLNAVITAALKALRSEGFDSIADRYGSEWMTEYSDFLIRDRFYDLGDHRPLLEFLVRFNKILERTIGKKAAHEGILGDIYDLNYAIPVSFAPRAEWWRQGTLDRDLREYRKHFVPLTDVVVYWSARLACERVMRSHGQAAQAKKLCAFIADKLRMAVGLYVAPKISDYVFRKANGLETRLEIGSRDVLYREARVLLDEFEAR